MIEISPTLLDDYCPKQICGVDDYSGPTIIRDNRDNRYVAILIFMILTDLAGTRLTGVQTLFLFQIENHSINNKSPKYKQDASQHPDFNGCESFGFGRVCVDVIEDVDEDKEDSDEDGHSTRNTLRRHQEADPRDYDEHTRGEVVGDDVVGHLTMQYQLESSHRIIAWKFKI